MRVTHRHAYISEYLQSSRLLHCEVKIGSVHQCSMITHLHQFLSLLLVWFTLVLVFCLFIGLLACLLFQASFCQPSPSCPLASSSSSQTSLKMATRQFSELSVENNNSTLYFYLHRHFCLLPIVLYFIYMLGM